MMEFTICPARLATGYNGYSPLAIKYLFSGRKAVPQLAFAPTGAPEEEIAHVGRTVYYAVAKKGRMRLIRKKEVGRLRLEFLPADGSREMAERRMANRHLTMQLSDQVYKICTQKSGMAFDPDGGLVLVLRREQVDDDNREHMLLTLRQALGDAAPDSLESALQALSGVSAPLMLTKERLFEQLIFNYIYGNDNASLSDYAFMEMAPGDMQLAPAFHLENTAIYGAPAHEGTLGAAVRQWVARYDTAREAFRQLGLEWGMVPLRLERLLDRFMVLPARVDALIDNSYLCPEDKMAYKLLVTSRYRQYAGAATGSAAPEPEPVSEPVPQPAVDLFGNPLVEEAPKPKKKGKDDEPAIVYGSLF